jgi:ComF family protein
MFLLDLLFPKKCLGCGKTGQYFCQICVSKIPPVEFQICPVCEKPSPFGQTHDRCRSKNSLDGFCSVFGYEGIIKEAIHKFKFRYVTDLSKELWNLTDNLLNQKKGRDFFLLNKFVATQNPVVLPVPLFWYKENLRGFNQAEILGKFLADKFSLKLRNDLLVRSKSTQSQAKLSEKERKRNVADAFLVPPEVQSSLFKILLVDDIWTSGATLKACGSLLKRAGAETVWGFTLAR